MAKKKASLDYIAPGLRPLAVPIKSLRLDPANARTGHAVTRIANSLAIYGQRKPVVVNAAEGNKVEAGNGLLQAALELGWTHVAAVILDDDPMTAVAFGIADNRLAELSEWDMPTLKRLMDALDPDLELETGFDAASFEELVAEAGLSPWEEEEREDAEPKIDKATELRATWAVEQEQLWRLPSRHNNKHHYLLCGDSTNGRLVQRLMGEERAVLFATDPPYLVGYDGQNHAHTWQAETEELPDYQKWDAPEQGEQLYDGFVGAAVEFALAENAAWYCWHASRNQAFVEQVWGRYGAFVHQQIIWVKDRPTMTRSWYLWQHEPCFMGWVRGKRPKKATSDFERTVWELETVQPWEENLHLTSKPVGLFEIPMTQHTVPGDVCYEPFSGSGSQLIAAENLGRQCRAMEIAPEFVAVALQRYEDAFGLRPELVN